MSDGLVARLHGPRDLRLHREAPPVVGPGDVLLEVRAVGLCGSDLHWYDQGAIGETRLETPVVPGHEISAVIAAGARKGTRVAVDPADPCGRCATCRGGHEELCATMRFAGHGSTDGGLRTLMAWPERLLHPIPVSIGDGEASLLEALGVALHAIDLGAMGAQGRAAVVGCGPIGLLVIAALRAAGIDDIVAIDLLRHRVDAARRTGARVAWLATDDDGPGPGATAEPGTVDVVFECSGTPDAVAAAITLAAPAGRVVLVGIPDDDRTVVPASTARRKGLTLVLCRRMTAPDLDRAIELVAGGRIDLAPLVSERFSLADAPAAFAALASRRGLKVVVLP
jgi:L-iditol 2-dehydrogenase